MLLMTLEGGLTLRPVLNSALAGLVSISAAGAVVPQWSAIIIGAIGAFVYFAGARFLEGRNIDDPLDSIAVHAGCGVWGTLAVGLFAENDLISMVYGAPAYLVNDGILTPVEAAAFTTTAVNRGAQFGIQAAGVAAVGLWTLVAAGVVFALLDRVLTLRVNEQKELIGIKMADAERSLVEDMIQGTACCCVAPEFCPYNCWSFLPSFPPSPYSR